MTTRQRLNELEERAENAGSADRRGRCRMCGHPLPTFIMKTGKDEPRCSLCKAEIPDNPDRPSFTLDIGTRRITGGA